MVPRISSTEAIQFDETVCSENTVFLPKSHHETVLPVNAQCCRAPTMQVACHSGNAPVSATLSGDNCSRGYYSSCLPSLCHQEVLPEPTLCCNCHSVSVPSSCSQVEVSVPEASCSNNPVVVPRTATADCLLPTSCGSVHTPETH